MTLPVQSNLVRWGKVPKKLAISVERQLELLSICWWDVRSRFVRGRGGSERYNSEIYNLLKDLGLSRTHINAFLERTSKAAIVGSYQIWLGRERSLDSGGERITRVK
ncbi:unnamed protein product [Danaus chrysippus]|uniref:(African queen) hypothetical protein n=1 Tax=Danaus chrysippus TaxID=151541 RepID=A0A8J2VUF0_9NEOP|nr:unnamed protein product [Danaus chrysippus]